MLASVVSASGICARWTIHLRRRRSLWLLSAKTAWERIGAKPSHRLVPTGVPGLPRRQRAAWPDVHRGRRRGGARPFVISDGYWKRGFGGDKDVLGKTIPFADRTCVVIGVMRPTFRYYAGWTRRMAPARRRQGRQAGGSTPTGLTFDQAQLDLNAVVARGDGVAVEYWRRASSGASNSSTATGIEATARYGRCC